MSDHSQHVSDCFGYVSGGDGTPDKFTLPCYPEEVSDQVSSSWNDQPIVGRSSPISSFAGTGFRSVSFSFDMHREMSTDTSIDKILSILRSAVYGRYVGSAVQPPITSLALGDFKIRGIVRSVSFNWKKPIVDGKYQVCSVSISMDELAPVTTGWTIARRNPRNPFGTNVSK